MFSVVKGPASGTRIEYLSPQRNMDNDSDDWLMWRVQDFEAVKSRTSIVPFQAIWEGRQKLPSDYYKEFLRVPYLAVLCTALGAYWAHPLMQRASYWLGW